MKKTSLITLAVVNILAFCTLMSVLLMTRGEWDYYYFSAGGRIGFGIAPVVLICSLLSLKKKSWRWGFAGLGILVLYLIGVLFWISLNLGKL